MKDISYQKEIQQYVYDALRSNLECDFGKKFKLQQFDNYIQFGVTGNSEYPEFNFLNGKRVAIEVQMIISGVEEPEITISKKKVKK
jgi:hypothetical protein